MKNYNLTRYLEATTRNLAIEVELPGVDPSTIKITRDEGGRIYLNDLALDVVNDKYYNCEAATASFKHGLLTIIVPYIKPVRPEIPLTIS